jgi:hypothetical protein
MQLRTWKDGSRNEIVGRQIFYQQGTYRRERIWLAGWYPELCRTHQAVLIYGLTGRETVLGRDAIRALNWFAVIEGETH